MTITSLNMADGKLEKRWMPQIKRRYVILAICLLIIIAGIVAAHFLGAFSKASGMQNSTTSGDGILSPPNPTKPLPPSTSQLHMFSRGAVCADGAECARIGNEILNRNGTAMDATIGALFCNSLVNMQSMGLGGGFFMTYYDAKTKKAYSLDSREVAPLKATTDMFKNDPKRAAKGPLSIGVPGELIGYWTAHKRFGNLPWKEIVQPSVELCEKGVEMTLHQHDSLHANARVKNDTLLRSWFLDENQEFKKIGTKIYPKEYCETLKTIAEFVGDNLYNSSLSAKLVEDLKDIGSIITAEDLLGYKPRWMTPINATFKNGDTLYTMPPPGSGALLGFILNILDGYNFTRESVSTVNETILTYHRTIEAFKYAYAKRTQLGDTDFIDIKELLANLSSRSYANDIRHRITDNQTYSDPKHYGAIVYSDNNDNGTAHISVLGPNGDAVSVTSTINLYFGSAIAGKRTGILFNNVMDDFSSQGFKNFFGLPPSPNNRIQPGKRPLSSMSPSIVVDKSGHVKVVIGSAGGTMITTSLAYGLLRMLWMGDNIKEAVDAPRIHHQLFPMKIAYEYGTLDQIVKGLEALGHETYRIKGRGSVICAIIKDMLKSGKIFANADYRKGGDVHGFD